MRNHLLSWLLMLSSALAFAHSGDHVIQRDEAGQITYEKVSIRFELAAVDVGMPGSYFIGLEGDRGNYYLHTPQGWEVFKGGLAPSYFDAPELATGVSVVLFETGRANLAGSTGQPLCDQLRAQTGSNVINVWVGYGILRPEHEERIASFHAINNPRLDPNHLRRVYITEDARSGSKTTKVLTLDCSPPPSF